MSRIQISRRLISGSWLIAALFASIAQASPVYNVVTDFSIANNPNGVWTYEVSGTPYPLSDGFLSSCNAAPNSCPAWSTFLPVPNGASILANPNSFVLHPNSTTFVPPGYLSIDPQGLSNQIVFTAPASATYQIGGQFIGDDQVGNAHPVSVFKNGTTSLFSTSIAHFGQLAPFDVFATLNAGDTITFDVETGSLPGSVGCSYCFLSTALWAEVTTSSTPIVIPEPHLTPEPGMLSLLSVGLAGLAFLRLRQRDKPPGEL